MIKMNKKLMFLSLTLGATVLAACGEDSGETQETLVDGDEIEIVHVNWDDAIASSNVMGIVLEDIGYDVTLTSLDNAVVWQSLAQDEADISVSGWLPITHGAQYEEFGDEIDHIGVNAEGARIGLVVPEYMEDVNSIEDLSDEAEQTITGIEPGAGIMTSTEEAMGTYDNLSDWNLQNSSTGAMTSELRTAIQDEEEIVVTGWNPHWKFQEFDLKYLEDPENAYGDAETINTLTREGLEEDHPVAYSVLENFQWEMEDIEEIMLEMSETGDFEGAAQNWVDENQETVQEWTADAEEVAQNQSNGE